ncbi:MAG: ATPase [Deltaproteobacteria bacterium]|nr:ATPase [Deltaproteobacteria bacterium]MBW2083594.1 ATPase [Deltaproteobacteria bacterium]HDM10198.1 ATPase [Desulfobacteraceae bacterium]
MLKIDISLIYQIANFLFLLFVLNLILYRPIRNIIRKRKEEMEGLEKAIHEYETRADESAKHVEEGMVLTRKEGFQQKEAIKQEGVEKEKSILSEAMEKAGDKVQEAKKEIEAKMEEVRRELEAQVATFSGELVEKILGRAIR